MLSVSRRSLVLVVATVLCAAPLAAQTPSAPVGHWAFRPVSRPALPAVKQRGWPRSPLDTFVLARQEAQGLTPAATADPLTLARRLSLTLTGLGLSLDELAQFDRERLGEQAPDDVDRLIDRLLASPAYGEHLARYWLDLARYADTHGYHADTHREMWRWRDWVIDALNQDLPFDQFSIEQLAGDLLPDPTLDQLIATGLQRNHMIIFENGVIGEEYRTEYVADRTTTFGTIWLAQTLQCARCHDHKHDPFTQRDFYRLAAFFNNVPENGVDGQFGNAVPLIKAPTPRQQRQLAELRDQIAAVTRQLETTLAAVDPRQAAWEASLAGQGRQLVQAPTDLTLDLPLEGTSEGHVGNRAAGTSAPERLELHGAGSWVALREGQALLLDGETWIEAGETGPLERDRPATWAMSVFPTTTGNLSLASRTADDNERRGWELALVDRRLRFRLTRTAGSDELLVQTQRQLPLRKWQRIMLVYDGSSRAGGVTMFVDGQREALEVVRDGLTGSVRVAGSLRIGRNLAGDGFRGMLDEVRLWMRALTADELAVLAGRDPAAEVLAIPPAQRTADQKRRLRQWFLDQHDEAWRATVARQRELQREFERLDQALPTTMVMRELPQPRITCVLARGDYQRPGERVAADWPATALGMPEADRPGQLPRNRLDLARWLFQPDQPLTARVAVNRFWQWHFGSGIVTSSDDFGTHGQVPSHPELLDWLAAEFRTGPDAWGMKRMHRLIVTSAAFQQSAVVDAATRQADPDNRWLTRGPRQRLAAETIRDQALAASGLLDRRIGGPSVFPWQPPGLWEELAYDTQSFTAQTYRTSSGGDLFRRGVYTFWKRAVPPPALAILDAPDRETCTVVRATSHSPLQALVLMNDPTNAAAAAALARQATQAESTVAGQLTWIVRSILGRPPQADELRVLTATLEVERQSLAGRGPAAEQILAAEAASGASIPSDPNRQLDRAALAVVASLILQLDETCEP